MFAIGRFCYTEVFFHIFLITGVKKKQFVIARTLLYRDSLN